MRRIGYQSRRFNKPQLGTVLGSSNLTQGLQIAALLNEDATGGPIIGVGSPVSKVVNLLGRNNGVGSGTIGPTPPQSNWATTKHGRGFHNNSSGTGGALDFGPQSAFPTFTSITCGVMAGFNNALGANSNRVVMAYDGSTINFVISMDQTNNKWTVQVNTVGGAVFVEFAPSRINDGFFMDFVAFTYDGTTLTGYLNGIKQGTAAGNALSFSSTARVQIGGTTLVNNQNTNQPLTVFYLWNRKLTAVEIQQLYLDPYWALVSLPRTWRAQLAIPPLPTPSGGANIPLVGAYATTKSGFGINQKIIAIPEMNTFEEVRQVLARVIGELQNHIATQLPIVDYKQRKITNVAPPTEGDDVVTLKYLQSVQLPAQPKSN